MNPVLLFGCLFLCLVTSATKTIILVSDPAYVAQELNHLQSELQDLRVLVNYQQQTIASLQNNTSTQKHTIEVQGQIIASLQNNTSTQKHTIEVQGKTIASLQNNTSTQKHTIEVQGQTIASLQNNTSTQKHIIEVQGQTIASLQQTVTSQQSAIATLTQRGSDKGTVFTRWGRSDCPVGNGTNLVYSGYVGGGYFEHAGGGSNTLCMPDDPSPGQNHYDTNPGFIYGAEIQQGYDVFGLPQNDEDVACAVCRNSIYATSVMIPARNACFPGWVEAYSGFIVAGFPDHPSSTNYICMDGHPRPIPGGQANDEGVLLRPVVTKCGSLPCPPYQNDKLVPCVVCMM